MHRFRPRTWDTFTGLQQSAQSCRETTSNCGSARAYPLVRAFALRYVLRLDLTTVSDDASIIGQFI